jgi:nucleoside phosphorylase
VDSARGDVRALNGGDATPVREHLEEIGEERRGCFVRAASEVERRQPSAGAAPYAVRHGHALVGLFCLAVDVVAAALTTALLMTGFDLRRLVV